MDIIPIFSGAQEDDLDSWLTCGQFLAIIEDQCNKNELILTEDHLKEICLTRLSGSALDLFQKHQIYDEHIKSILS